MCFLQQYGIDFVGICNLFNEDEFGIGETLFNCSIVAPSPFDDSSRLSRALGHDFESPSYFWFGFASSALVSKEYPDLVEY